ncbi:MAG: hypothetical protein M1816_007962 [Peltula sp. TS41687]|nr:MAG: hypothetical protein M1816_007962 [Peltula sp. TS41687]
MVRPLLPKEEQTDSPNLSDSGLESKSAKRRCVSSACIPCRKRKSKCDGGVPTCSTCAAVYHTECAYDVDTEHKRKSASKKDMGALTEGNGVLAAIISAIRNSTDAEAAEIVHRIRSGEPLETVTQTLKLDVTLSGRSDSNSLESDFADIVGTTKVNRSGVTRYFGNTSGLGLVPSDADGPAQPESFTDSWTRLTRDTEFIHHLMELYFCWEHPFYVLFSRECFLHDMNRGRSKYCSQLLMNALLAAGCNFSDRPEARTDPDDPNTAGDHFFGEARRLLIEDESSSLTTVQALGLMGIRETSCGRDSAGYQYAGRCIRMALELGLHLCFTGAPGNSLTPTEIEVRKVTFWGCFTMDTAWSLCIGRISQLPRTAISIKKPTLADAIESKPWKPYIDTDVDLPAELEQPGHTCKVLQQFSFLSEIVSDTLFMFYAPRERFTILAIRGDNREQLDATGYRFKVGDPSLGLLGIADESSIYYHTVVLHLFRPFLKVDLLDSSISPRAICTESAENISILADGYRNLYTLRRECVLMSHCLLSASTIHLLNLPSPRASRYITDDLRNLNEASVCHGFAGRCLRIIQTLAQKWEITLPEEASRIGSTSSTERPSPSESSEYLLTPWGGSMQPRMRRDSVTELVPTDETALSASLSDLFWTPFPYQGIPLQATLAPSPMDISSMLDVTGNDWEQYTRDGFKMTYANDITSGGSNLTDDDWARIYHERNIGV